ncbi:MAG TPA: SUMF1/EgtB/PvdO family nonheme iron enzyme, partial [Kofleriaceae bacterium]
EASWAKARQRQTRARVAYGAALAELDAAVLVDGGRRNVRDAMAHTLFELATFVEAAGDPAAATEVAMRLAAFDHGPLVAAWRRPATLAIDAPGAARIELHERSGAPPLALAPRTAHELVPGSYTVVLHGADETVVRVPVLVARAEQVALAIAMPRAIPPGMVYVPAGRFLVGRTTDDENYRRDFLQSPPLHAVTTGAYFIGKTEVTFADWMAYLDTLAGAEREQRRPKLETVSLDGGKGTPYLLAIQPASHRLVARAGEPLVYLDRAQRQRVRWERLPVSGISFDDARAYAAWLASSGRVPGARLCTDHEWERAARGADGRLWAHGDAVAPDDANIDVTYQRKPGGYGPDEVGSHPRSTSPFGLDDTVGNVWEWVAGPGTTAVLRGGGWYHTVASAVSSNRDFNDPALETVWLGFRICATA